PAVAGTWQHGELVVSASLGYSHALADASTHHDHGPWPLVDPMNVAEITWNAAALVTLGRELHGGMRLWGGIPTGDGHERVVSAARVGWTDGGTHTAVEVQAGLAGDPLIIRGAVETALHF